MAEVEQQYQMQTHFAFFVVLCFGAAFLSTVNATVDVLAVISLMFSVGLAFVFVLFRGKKTEISAFFYTFSVCVFFSGLAQTYSLLLFDNLQSTTDAAIYFYPEIKLIPPFEAPSFDILFTAYRLAIFIWQQVYILTWHLGIDGAPYIGVLFNTLIMAITASITVNIARTLYGNDRVRLQKVAILFSLCGIFIMFGAILLRGCFTTFLNTLVLWAIIKCLCYPKVKNIIIALVIIISASVCMISLRFNSVLLFGAFIGLALIVWLLQGPFNRKRITASVIILVGVAATIGILSEYFNQIVDVTGSQQERYSAASSIESAEGSLGLKFIVNQPWPIRLLAGSLTLIVNPIPFWAYFNMASFDSHWLMGLFGIYKIVLMPSVISSSYFIVKGLSNKQAHSAALFFLVAYLLFNTFAVVLTSLEQRHIGQFMAAFILIAVFLDNNSKHHRNMYRSVWFCWFGTVFLIHLAWVSLKLFSF